MNVPFTQTITLNVVDNPVAVYLDRGNDGSLTWQLRMHPEFAADREAVKAAVLELNQFCTRWFFDTYGFTPPPEAA